MELIEGQTLDERIRGGLTIEQALPIFQQITEALEAAHERGIVHRDLKPANVIVRERTYLGFRMVQRPCYRSGTPMATGRIGEPAAPFSRKGRMMVHDVET